MGINLICYVIEDDKEVEQTWFDSIRHRWDNEFISQDSFPWSIIKRGHEYDCEFFMRPSDFSKARQWVNAVVTERGNAKRLHDLLNFMESNPNAYIYVSW